VYQPQAVNTARAVSLAVEEMPIGHVLNMLFDGGASYEEMGDLVVIKPVNRSVVAPSSVSGKITDAKTGEPLPGVNVAEKGTPNGTVADEGGKYALTIDDPKAVLVFSFVGYISQEIPVSSRGIIDVQLAADEKQLDEVVVVGYGTQKKASMTSAVSSVKASDFSQLPATSLSNSLQGRLSGTYVQTYSGFPGNGSKMRVRINTSWNDAPVVFVINGVVRDEQSFNALDPNEIEDVTVLKDAASAAVYGSRSSNGVILVTTKQGKSGKPSISFMATSGLEELTQLPQYMEAGESLRRIQEVTGNVSDEEIQWVMDNNPKQMNMFNAALRTPKNQRYAFSASGGSDKVTYYLGGSYASQTGFVNNVSYDKYNLRADINAKVTKNLTAGLNLSTNNGMAKRYSLFSSDANDGEQEMYRFLLYINPWAPPTIDGKYPNLGWLGNPLGYINGPGYRRNNNQQVDALLTLNYKIPAIEGLGAKLTFSKNNNDNSTKEFNAKHKIYNFRKRGANSRIFTNEVLREELSNAPAKDFLSYRFGTSRYYQLDAYLTYVRSFGKHHVDAVAIFEQFDFSYTSVTSQREVFPLVPVDQYIGTSGDNQNWNTNGREFQDARKSYVGRINYDYDEKYLLTLSVRRDGSTKFAPHKRWGNFPAVGLGWALSKEDFFSEALGYVNYLKFRGTFAQTGNDAIGGWSWLDQYNFSSHTYFLGQNGTAAPRVNYGGIPNPELTWEKSNTWNLGMDMTVLKNISFSAEFWKRHTYDILGNRILAIPAEFGGSLPKENYGIVDAYGAEFEAGYKTGIGSNWRIEAKGNFSLSGNMVIKRDVAANALPIDDPNGKPLTYQAGYKTAGILRTDEQVKALPLGYTIFGAVPEKGMMNFQDISGIKNVPDGKIDTYDRVLLGNYFGPGGAQQTYGLNLIVAHKSFTLGMFFSGLGGFKTLYNDSWGRNFSDANLTVKYHEDSWTESNPNGKHPKLYRWGDARAKGYVEPSDFNAFNSSFVRMKNLSLAYSIPKEAMKKLRISSFQIFANASNLFCLSQFKFYDPELYGFGAYPFSKSFSLGIDVRWE